MKLRDNGFTLIEVLTVVAILALLAGLAVPRVFGQIEESRVTAAMTDCSTIGKALSLSMLSHDIVPAQNDIEYLRKWPDKNPWGGSYSLSSNDDYVANKYIRLGMTDVPEQSYQSLKGKMGDQVDRAKDGTVYMYIHGTGGSAGGEPGGPSVTPVSDYDVFDYVGYAGGNSIVRAGWKFVNSSSILYAVGNVSSKPNDVKQEEQVRQGQSVLPFPSFDKVLALRDFVCDEVHSGNYTIDSIDTVSNKSLRINGDLRISRTGVKFHNVTLYVTGNLVITGDASNTTFSNSTVYVGGAIEISKNNTIFDGSTLFVNQGLSTTEKLTLKNSFVAARGPVNATNSNNDLDNSLVIGYRDVTMSVNNLKGAVIAERDLVLAANELQYIPAVKTFLNPH